jgi:hypothetical protein
MKVTINIDCTPEEARAFLGAPNFEKIQKSFFEAMQKNASEHSEQGQVFDMDHAQQAMQAFTQYNFEATKAFQELLLKSMASSTTEPSESK